VALKGSVPAKDVPGIWYQVRKKVDDIRWTLPQGVIGPTFNDEFGDTYSVIYGVIADGFTHRELRDYVEGVRSRLLLVQDVNKVDIIGAQDERLYLEVSAQQTSGSLSIAAHWCAPCRRKTPWRRPASCGPPRKTFTYGFRAVCLGERPAARESRVARQLVRLNDIGTVTRAYADPPQPMFRVNGSLRSRSAFQCARGATFSLSATTSSGRWFRSRTACRSESSRYWWRISRTSCPTRSATSCIPGGGAGHRDCDQLPEPRIAGGRRGGLSIPVVLATVFIFMDLSDIALQRSRSAPSSSRSASWLTTR
jgi:hypothetical protein